MINLEISQHGLGKIEWSRPLIESCLKTLERRCSFAETGPAHCRVRVAKEHAEGHSNGLHQPLQIVAHIELTIPGRGKPLFAHFAADHLRTAVAGAAEAIEKMLRRETEKNESARRAERRSRRSRKHADFEERAALEELAQSA